MIRCLDCGGYVPLPERRGDETWCCECGKAYREVGQADPPWYAQQWELYAPVEDKR